jgi:hypothetical protein
VGPLPRDRSVVVVTTHGSELVRAPGTQSRRGVVELLPDGREFGSRPLDVVSTPRHGSEANPVFQPPRLVVCHVEPIEQVPTSLEDRPMFRIVAVSQMQVRLLEQRSQRPFGPVAGDPVSGALLQGAGFLARRHLLQQRAESRRLFHRDTPDVANPDGSVRTPAV